MTAPELRYAGPAGEGIEGLPAGVGAAIGSEYCVHLLPGPEEARRAAELSRRRGAPLLLLTPYFRDGELRRACDLLRAVPEGADVDVAVNDWGLLHALRALFPALRRSVGRLLSGQKRCPRIGISPRLTDRGRRWHAEGLFSSPRARKYLEEEAGVGGYHLDLLHNGMGLLPRAADGSGKGRPVRHYVHGPYGIVTVSDACPWIGGLSSAARASCDRPCRNGTVILREPSMGQELIQRGKARFVRTRLLRPGAPPGAPALFLVRYDDLP